MYVCYKQESFFEIFARFLCHNLCLRGKCIFVESEILEIKHNLRQVFAPPKNYLEPP